MTQCNGFWRLDHLSDAQLLESLGGVLGRQRRSLAELVAHLAEVEERRLQLEAACSSMFSYCVGRLAMSEDEACRRLDLARLARRFPVLFAELESGRLTLSAALLLKPVQSADNHLELVRAARGKTSEQVRELVAERFPKPDAPSSIRKLPERRPRDAPAPASPMTASPAPASPMTASPMTVAKSPVSPVSVSPAFTPVPLPAEATAPRPLEPPAASVSNVRTHAPRSIDPLAAQRYRIQFTADAALKAKLERARDLLRHAHPGGDFAPIVSRALDLLLDELLRRRFGVGKTSRAPSKAARATATNTAPPASPAPVAGARPETGTRRGPGPSPTSAPLSTAAPPMAPPPPPRHAAQPLPAPPPPAPPIAQPAASVPAVPPPARPARRPHLPLPTRRAVLERDGLGCSWTDVHGRCCGNHAWLELDHRQPWGKGGCSDPDNVRLLCRAHHHLAAEQVYGRA